MVKVGIYFTLGKYQGHKKTINPSIPRPKRLLQFAQGLLKLHTCVFLSCVSNPSGCSTYNSSSTTPFKKDILTSIWCNFHFITATKASMVIMEVYLTTSANVSSKSMPSFYEKPRAMNLSLCFLMLPYAVCLIL